MYGIEQLTQSSFTDKQVLTQIIAQTRDLIEHMAAPEAYKMAMELEQKLKELAAMGTSEPQFFGQYRQILTGLKFLSIAHWPDEVYSDLIKNHLADILGSNINISERMTAKVYIAPEMVWPDVAEQTLDVLRQNIQPIGSSQLIIAGEKVTHPSIIKYWLLDYDRSLGMEKHENIQRAKYFTDSRNFQGLNETDKTKVQQLLEFFDALKPLPIPEETMPQRPEGVPTIAIPRQKGEEGEFSFREEETPEFPYLGQQLEPSPSSYQPPAKASIPPWQPTQQPSPPPGALPIGQPLPPPSPPPQQQSKDTYREQVAPQDLAGPQATQRPTPKLNGNVINLKDFGTGQQ